MVDTGVDCTHPDFANAGGTSKDSAYGGQLNFAKSTAYVTTTVSPAACPWQDDYGHGTHVAGTIAAAASNAVGATGLAYTASIAAFKTSNSSGMSSDYAIAQSIMMAADRGAKAISISLGAAGYSQTLEDAIKYAWQHNALVVAAAGNNNSNAVFYPGDASHAMTVAAVDTKKAKASYSNWGDFIGIAAPGSSIYSTAPTYSNTMNLLNYASLSGTSMATPHVSAVAGLLATAYPDAPATAIAARLQQAASSSNANGGWDQYSGYGVLDAGAAVTGTLRPANVGSVTGQIVDVNRIPASGALVSVAGATYTTGSSGLYRLSNLPSGPQQVSISTSGYATMTFTVTVPQGADVNVPIKLGTTLGSYTGFVSSGGAPLAGAVVEVLSGGLIQAAVVTAADGSYTVPVLAGTYDLRASALGYIATTSSSVAAGTASRPASVNFSLTQLGNITGTVVDASGGGVANAQLLFSSNNFAGGAITDADGQFTSLGLPAGTYTVTAQAVGFDDVTITGVVVAPDSSARAGLQFDLGLLSTTVGASSTTGPSAVANNTVTLNAPAPAGGVVVALSSSSDSVSVPASVTVPAGATSTTFSVSTVSVPASTAVTITATYTDSSRSATITVLPPVMSKITVATTAFAPGTTVTATAYINAAAPDSGATVTLSASPATSVTIPATVVIPAGKTSATFTIAISGSASPGTVMLSGTFGGLTKTAPLNIGSLALASMAMSPTSLLGGASSSASSVTLNGPAQVDTVVSLSSSDPAVTVPDSVTVPAGATSATYTITTSPVSAATPVVITATLGVSKSATLTVNAPALSTLALSPTSVVGGNSTVSNTVTLSGIAPAAGMTVSLSSSNGAASVPATVTVPAGAKSVTFAISTSGVAAATPVSITANYGTVTKTVTLTVNPAALSSVTLNPTSLTGGTSSTTSTVNLTGAAPAAGLVVTLTDSSAYVTVPASITIPAGATSATFTVSTATVTAKTTATITASYNGVNKAATQTVTP